MPHLSTMGIASNAPFLHSGTQRKHKESSSDVSSSGVLMQHQMNNIFKDYDCGCAWTVPEGEQGWDAYPHPTRVQCLLEKGLIGQTRSIPNQERQVNWLEVGTTCLADQAAHLSENLAPALHPQEGMADHTHTNLHSLTIYLSIYVSMYVRIYLSIDLSIYLSIYLL